MSLKVRKKVVCGDTKQRQKKVICGETKPRQQMKTINHACTTPIKAAKTNLKITSPYNRHLSLAVFQ